MIKGALYLIRKALWNEKPRHIGRGFSAKPVSKDQEQIRTGLQTRWP
jgi:hypothetical protein